MQSIGSDGVQLMKVNVELDNSKQINRLTQQPKKTTQDSESELKQMFEKQQNVLNHALKSNKTLVKFISDFKSSFERFKQTHKTLQEGNNNGSVSARSNQSVNNEDRPSSSQVIRRRIIRVDDNVSERSTSRTQRNQHQFELDMKD